MNRFNVGERVRLIGDNNGFGGVGDIGKVVTSDYARASVIFESGERKGQSWWVEHENLEHAQLFAVGDRVRVVKIGNFDSERVSVGDVATITALPWDGCGSYELEFNPPWHAKFEQWADASHFEPTQQPLRIEVGRYYKTRDGRKVGPMEEWCNERDLFTAPGTGGLWHDDGTPHYAVAEKTDSPKLIAEWSEPTPVPAPVLPAAKFKVGDSVRNVTVPEAGTGIVEEVRGDGNYLVNFKDTWYARCTDREGSLRLVAPPRPAIVARLDNGQPRPSPTPFIHVDTAAAAREAERLAGKHPGKEFGVYELVDRQKVAKVYDHEWQWLAASGDTKEAARRLKDETGIPLISARGAVDYWLRVAA